MNRSPSGPSLPSVLRALLRVIVTGVVLALLGAALRWFALAFGYQPNDANLPLTLALAAVLTVSLVWWRWLGQREPDDPDPHDPDPHDPDPHAPDPERNEE